MGVITRFAPSPTGFLHVGNARTALINWLFAKKHGGMFVLRLDDTDTERSEARFEQGIIDDLSWLGITWDRFERQRDRLARYEEVKHQLISAGRLYPCFETEEDLEIKRKILLSQGKPPVYDRAALSLTAAQIAEHERAGRRPHYRFKLEHRDVVWDDLVQGEVKMNAASFSDPVVVRENGTWTYMLCSVIDDIDFSISHVIRGEDHISNTLAQIQFFEALGARVPTFAHLARITSKTEKISKRLGGFDIQSLRDDKEIEAMTINSFFALIGTSKDIAVFHNINDLVADFSIENFHKSPTNYDEAELVRLNHKVLASYSFMDVKDRLIEIGLPHLNEPLWNIIGGNISVLSEAKHWYAACYGEIAAPALSSDDREFVRQASGLLPRDHEWHEGTWDIWIGEIKKHTERKGKELFMPLRLALTGVDHGPELKVLLPLIGIDRAQQRLEAA